jgi:hypothetical protein
MKHALAATFALALVLGCSKTEPAPGSGATPATTPAAPAPATAPPPAGGDLKADLAKLKTAIAAARTSDDFMKVTTECGGLEIKGAMSGQKVGEDPDYRAVCKVQAATTRARLAIQESTPKKLSPHCLSASMAVEDLIGANIDKAANEKLLADLKKACGL